LSDPSSKGTLKKASILPDEYLILCPVADTAQYKPFGRTLGLSPWPSLNNLSDQIVLKSFTNRTVDSVAYADTWYKNNVKKSGGWTLERIDPKAICTGKENWTAGEDARGGTPGQQNSVFRTGTGSEPLKLISAVLTDSITITLTFNRVVDSFTATHPHNYSLNNGAGTPVSASNDTGAQVILKYPAGIARGNTYKVTASNISDCAGSVISAPNNSAEFFYAQQIAKGDVLITEILFNPRPDGADFVEIYNNSNSRLDLSDLDLASVKGDSLISIKPISSAALILEPGAYFVLTTDPDNIRKEYRTESTFNSVKMASLPAFNDDAGVVVLVDNSSRIDQLNYNAAMHLKLIRDPEGVSLERSSFNRATNDPGNFRSAAASAGYATPGYRNSQFTVDLNSEQEVFLASPTFSPDNDGFEDFLEVRYQLSEPGWIANATVYTDRGIRIRKIANNLTLAAEGYLNWDGLNESEHIAPVGIYILYLEIFNERGQVKKYRRSFVLATKLN
ncbi:MAG TPA: lamin tail domain-containing protein, partial [Sphingobacteriaceae bacterium]